MRNTFIGRSEKMNPVFEFIRRAAPSDASVLILGESGTGKELVATALQENSARRGEPYLKVNSATLSPELLVSEMFGHERGAFTGADRRQIGKFEQAHRGTLFLDEIGDLDARAQGMLLRVLEEGEIQRLGGTETIHVDVRVIAATRRDLWTAVQDGKVREDLFYRLAVLIVTVPPLRERKEDIPTLIWHFIRQFSEERSTPITSLSPEADAILRGHRWPGNVRELRNAAQHASVMCPEDEVRPEHLPAGLRFIPAVEQTLDDVSTSAMRQRVLDAYSTCNSVEEIAHVLRVHRTTVPRLLDKLGLAYLKRRQRMAGAHL
jgi:two-component system, NtrC family, response regulator HydG